MTTNTLLIQGMRNQAMARKLQKGEAIDVSSFPAGLVDCHYLLDSFAENIDYCDAKKEAWVWSIGRRRRDGQIIASLVGDLYQNPDFECLWLR